jgi:hypothetical protein
MDLSRIPEPLRSKLQAQLAALPAEYRGTLEKNLERLPLDRLEEVLARNAPLIERLAGKKQASSAGGRSVDTKSGALGGGSGLAASHTRSYDPNDHYNATVMRGDRAMPSGIVLVYLALVAAVMLYLFGAFSGG